MPPKPLAGGLEADGDSLARFAVVAAALVAPGGAALRQLFHLGLKPLSQDRRLGVGEPCLAVHERVIPWWHFALRDLLGGFLELLAQGERTVDSLAEEIVSNAVSAAISDPRFDPVREHELADLVYSVDVLFAPEPADIEALDPKVYGVIVEDESEERRGLLLPDIPGVDSARQQVEIATRKAGIPHGTPVKLSRFKVERYRERTA